MSDIMQLPPNHIMVGRAAIPLRDINKGAAEYQEWLSAAPGVEWGNVNIMIDTNTLKFDFWLDYGSREEDDGKTIHKKGTLRELSQAYVNKVIGKKIYELYPYKHTLKSVVAIQNRSRSKRK